MSSSSTVHLINKGSNRIVSDHLNSRELDCQCNYDDCTYTLLNAQLLTKWMLFRARMGQPVHINSAYRCKKHNKDVGSQSPDSRHVRGSALDLRLIANSEKVMIDIAKQTFPYVKVYDTFIHVDVRDL